MNKKLLAMTYTLSFLKWFSVKNLKYLQYFVENLKTLLPIIEELETVLSKNFKNEG